jgi:hypothetical protein
MCVLSFNENIKAVQVRVQVTWRNNRWWKALHIKLFGIVHVAVPTVIMFGVSSLLCSVLKSQVLYMYLGILVCLLMLSLLGDQRLQFFLKNGQFICRVHSLKSVSGIMKFMFEGQTLLPHSKGACVHIPQRVCCFLPGSADRMSLVSIFNLCLF